jgi:replicative DNA helicase|tara:strand:+ start:5581 stop:6831 length:1251 start_codon:yes stop_codon:yes gene_type:complete
METGNLRLYILRTLLTKEKYDKLKSEIDISIFQNGAREIYKTISNTYRDNPNITQINFSDLKLAYFNTYYPNTSYASQKSIHELIDSVERQEEPSDDVVATALKSMYRIKKADELARICLDISNNPSSTSLKQVEKFMANIDEEQTQQESEAVTKDVDKIIEALQEQGEFKFNLPSLQTATNGIGRGNFMVIIARPETGKTAFWVSLVASTGGFAWQQKKVSIFANEEPAIRTQMRLLNSSTGLERSSILNGSRDIAKEKWATISPYIDNFDCVGKTMDDLDEYCSTNDVDILIIDQLDKINVAGKYNATHEKLREVYTQSRELAKRHNILVIGMSQASAEAQGRSRVTFSTMENSKTGKAAEADIILGIGKEDEEENFMDDCVRFVTLSKNKLTGNHKEFEVILRPTISRFAERK